MARSFQYRHETEQLRSAAAGGDTAVLCQAVTDAAGPGNSRLVADYAHDAWEAGGADVLVWG
ncbi:hypothetical protein [Streptomyces pratensis]|uniref:hypothetical protein n=1 Tax=Streptomyces pratensis TaxID=1169025 RepID=UPI0019342EA7|nr:hypothetical protein [Streptomyces pratensis]